MLSGEESVEDRDADVACCASQSDFDGCHVGFGLSDFERYQRYELGSEVVLFGKFKGRYRRCGVEWGMWSC